MSGSICWGAIKRKATMSTEKIVGLARRAASPILDSFHVFIIALCPIYVNRFGVGSEAYGAVSAGRKAIGIELKASYYAQAVKNLESVTQPAMDQGAFALEVAP